jgi:hypothetical protein
MSVHATTLLSTLLELLRQLAPLQSKLFELNLDREIAGVSRHLLAPRRLGSTLFCLTHSRIKRAGTICSAREHRMRAFRGAH